MLLQLKLPLLFQFTLQYVHFIFGFFAALLGLALISNHLIDLILELLLLISHLVLQLIHLLHEVAFQVLDHFLLVSQEAGRGWAW